MSVTVYPLPDVGTELGPFVVEAVHPSDVANGKKNVTLTVRDVRDQTVSSKTWSNLRRLLRDANVVVPVALAPQAPRPPRRSSPKFDHGPRNAEVLRLHNEGLGTREIAERMGLGGSVVSDAKTELGIGANCTLVRVWGDIQHITILLEASTPQLERLASLLQAEITLPTSEEEVRSCFKRLQASATAVRRLSAALERRLPK